MTRTTRTVALLAFLLAMTPTAVHADNRTPSPYSARLDAQFVSSGLTASDVAARAVATSPELEANKQDLIEAAAQVDQALAAYIPNLTLKANHTRLSDPGSAPVGNIFVAPGAPAGPVPAGTRLVNAPLEFATISRRALGCGSRAHPCKLEAIYARVDARVALVRLNYARGRGQPRFGGESSRARSDKAP